MLIDRINERAKGELTIELTGGPEVVPAAELAMTVKKGMIDMAFLPACFSASLVPGAETVGLSQLLPEEEIEVGAFDIWQEEHKKAGLYYLGRAWTTHGPGFYIFTREKVETPSDLVGQKIQSEVSLRAFLTEAGAISVSLPREEIYTALERGVIDGFFNPLDVVYGKGWNEVVEYCIDHPFMQPDDSTIISLDTWNRLPKHLRSLVIEVQRELLADVWPSWCTEYVNEKRGLLVEAGMEFIKFSPADAKWYLDNIYRTEWERQLQVAPEVAPKLRELLSK